MRFTNLSGAPRGEQSGHVGPRIGGLATEAQSQISAFRPFQTSWLWHKAFDFLPLSCSPFQAAGANILLLAIERFKSTAVRQGKRHDHENDG